MMIQKYLLMIIVSLMITPHVFAEKLAGVWKNVNQPVSIEINFDEGQGIGRIFSNDNNPESVGKTLLKQLVAKNDGWSGKIYAEQLGQFKDAVITLPNPDQMKIVVSVGFMTRTVNWQRVER